MPADVIKHLRNNDALESLNANMRSYHQELADFCLPRKAWINSLRSRGERLKFNFLYDATAILALRTQSAGFHSQLTNPASRWFEYRAEDDNLMKIHDNRVYFKETTDKTIKALNKSHFDNACQERYMDVGCFGTGVTLTLKDPKKKLQFKAIPIEQVNLEHDANGDLIAVYRNFQLSAHQAHMLWGDAVGKSVMESLAKKPFEMFDFMHVVCPRYAIDTSKIDALNFPFESSWIAKKDKHLIHESGFKTMPYTANNFWEDSLDPFGFSPAMDVLPWIKLVNAMLKTIIRASMKIADPPWDAPSRGYTLPLNFNPSAINYRDPKLTADGLKQLVQTGQIPVTLELVQHIQDKILDGMYAKIFSTFSDVKKEMPVAEVQKRIADNMNMLGPVAGRYMGKFLNPTLYRVFDLLHEQGDFPDPPADLQDQDFQISFLGPLAIAQRQAEATNLQSFVGDVAGIGQFKMTAWDKIDEDKYIDILSNIRSVNPDVIRSEHDIIQIRDQRLKMQQAQLQLHAANVGAKTAKDGAHAEKLHAEAQHVGAGS